MQDALPAAPRAAARYRLTAINATALAEGKRILAATSLANANAATDPAEREHHLMVARIASR